jgi:leucyl-tRNA synthetase
LLPIVKDFGENDIVIGHSLGGSAAMHLLQKIKNTVKAVYLFGTTSPIQHNWDLLQKEWPDSDIDSLAKFAETKIDLDSVNKMAIKRFLILSDDDPYIALETKDFFDDSWEKVVWSGFGHIQQKQSKEILDIILKSEDKNIGYIPLDEKDLPLKLPEVEKFQTSDTGESPLATMPEWVNVKCPKCGGSAQRETDTMPQWAGSSWYFLRYIDPENSKALGDPKKLKYWLPVDWYNGGMEHTTLHLLYSRFWNKFLYDIGAIAVSEPYAKRTSHGLILGEGGEKMSKSRGNVINPDDIVKEFGADTFRVYEMFMGPFDQPIPWDTKGVIGVRRFLEKVWRMSGKVSDGVKKLRRDEETKSVERLIHQTIKKVCDDILSQDYNTAVSQLMILANKLSVQKQITKKDFEAFIILLSPFAPHICEELWEAIGNKESITFQEWPKYDEDKASEEEVEMVIQINGKVRDKINVASGASEEEVTKLAKESLKVSKYFEAKEIKKVIFIPDKLINFVV